MNGFWSITKYEDILFISRHPELFSSEQGIAGPGFRPAIIERMLADPLTAQSVQARGASLITMDPPRHVKMRRLVNKGFTPRAVNAMEPTIREITRSILDDIAQRGECDFVTDVAAKLPLAVICGMVGVEKDAWHADVRTDDSVLGSGDPEYQTEVPEKTSAVLRSGSKDGDDRPHEDASILLRGLADRRQTAA